MKHQQPMSKERCLVVPKHQSDLVTLFKYLPVRLHNLSYVIVRSEYKVFSTQWQIVKMTFSTVLWIAFMIFFFFFLVSDCFTQTTILCVTARGETDSPQLRLKCFSWVHLGKSAQGLFGDISMALFFFLTTFVTFPFIFFSVANTPPTRSWIHQSTCLMHISP